MQPGLDVGKIGVRNGMYMASADEIYITVHGEGGHAAAPHLMDTDTVYVASQIVVALQFAQTERWDSCPAEKNFKILRLCSTSLNWPLRKLLYIEQS